MSQDRLVTRSSVLTVVGALFWLLSFLTGCATVPVVLMPQPTIADAAWGCDDCQKTG